MANFANYELTPDLSVYELADGLIPEVAAAADYELTPSPDEKNIEGLVGKLGPEKELQRNIAVVREALGGDHTQKIADWIEQSGIMAPVERSFVKPSELPEKVDFVVWSGGVANWILRRAAMTQRLDPEKVGQVLLPMGKRVMKPVEHQLVATYEKRVGLAPTETDFASSFVVPVLESAGFDAHVIDVDSKNGDEILKGFFDEAEDVLDGTITVVSNAPNAIQAAGQLRVAGVNADTSFDSNGDQLFMMSDSFPLARAGEATKTHQNPETALAQLARNALFLERNRPAA